MKQIIKLILLFFLFISPAISYSQKDNAVGEGTQGYNIKADIEGIKDTLLILGYYFNGQIYVKDTIEVDSHGTGTFTGKEPLDGGMYIIYLPDKSYFDVLIGDDQDFSIKATDGNLINSQKITGSAESESFLHYQQFLTAKQKEAQELQDELKNEKKGTPRYDKIIDKLKTIKKEVDDQMDKTIRENPGTLLASFLTMTKEIEVPDFDDVPENTVGRDSVIQSKKYLYYKKHYFDNIDLNDARLLRTPVFKNKLDHYFTKLIIQQPDTLIKEANMLIGKAGDKEVRKYLIQYLFNMANDSKIMGMDAMIVDMADKYYLSGEATWADSTFLSKLQERVTKIRPNLIGNTAPDLKLTSVDGQVYRLSEVRAPLTILVFWEPTCGHCKTEIPKLKKLVWDKYQKDGIKIFAVYTQLEQEPWKEFIEKHDLYEWINVYDPYLRSNFRNLYDIYSTPTIYVLDKNKKIIGKRIGVEQLPGFIDYQLKQSEQ